MQVTLGPHARSISAGVIFVFTGWSDRFPQRCDQAHQRDMGACPLRDRRPRLRGGSQRGTSI